MADAQKTDSADLSALINLAHETQSRLTGMHQSMHLLFLTESALLRANILSDARYQSDLRLEKFGQKSYSQNEEDGIIDEIFRRIGTDSRTFFEFGVGNGLENNTLNLLVQGWTGGWIEVDKASAANIKRLFGDVMKQGRLKLAESMVDRDNINDLIKYLGLPRNLDLLSIDIDGNDYHVWEAIDVVEPRAVVIEYNAKFPPPTRWVLAYNPQHGWDGSDQFGASLESMTELAQRKGYRLVGCNMTGSNAFFVRADLAAGKFEDPPTAKNFYHPARYFLTPGFVSGHAAGFGKGMPPDQLR